LVETSNSNKYAAPKKEWNFSLLLKSPRKKYGKPITKDYKKRNKKVAQNLMLNFILHIGHQLVIVKKSHKEKFLDVFSKD